MGWLSGKVALITGGGSGIGRAVVERFVSEGTRIGVLERSTEKADALRSIYPEGVHVVLGDVTSYSDNLRAVRETVEAFGQLDIFVGNAGIFDGNIKLVDLPEESMNDAFDEVFNVNVKGYLYGAKATWPYLCKTQGSMIFTVSNSGFYPGSGGPLYTASKHAVVGLIRELAYELAPFIRVNGVAPAGTITDLRGPNSLDQSKKPLFDTDQSWEERIRSSKPLDIAPTAQDHTGVYVLLASSANSCAITGEIIRSDGGIGIRGLNNVAGGYDLKNRL